jgi:TRAP transporter TAXI family solute receptor
VFTLLFTTACGSGDSASNGGENKDTGSVENDNDASESINYLEYPSTVKIGTASQGGTYFIVGGGLAALLEVELGVTANVEVTGGPVHNMQLIQAGDQDIGFSTLGPAYEGFTGTGEWTGGTKMEDVRLTFPMFTTPIHWWALESSGVTKLEDIKGKRVGVGPAGGTPGTYIPLIHEALELDTTDVQASAGDMASQQLDGQLDIIGFASGIPIPVVSEIEVQRKINFFGIVGGMRDKVIDRFPYFFPYTIPADLYTTLDHDIETVAMFNFGIIRKDANPEFVYDLVKTYHENHDKMIQAHASMKEAVVEAITINDSVPLHPGAIKYYEEVGIELPESAYPAEWK